MRARKRILVVDDEDMILDILTSLLEEEGYEVLTARHPGLAKIRANDIDLIVLDLQLSGKDELEGKTVLSQLWEDKGYAIPIIIYSAYISSSPVHDSIDEIVRVWGEGRKIYKCVEKGGGVMNLIDAIRHCLATEEAMVPA